MNWLAELRKAGITAVAIFSCFESPHAAEFDCEAEEVIEVLINNWICVGAFDCQKLGAGFQTVKELSDKSVDEIYVRAMHALDASGTAINSPAYVPFYEFQYRTWAEGLKGAIGMMASVNAYVMDYNDRIGRYECEAQISYNVEERDLFLREFALRSMTDDPTMGIMLKATLEKQGIDMVKRLHEAQYRVIQARAANSLNIAYSVVPSKGGFKVIEKRR